MIAMPWGDGFSDWLNYMSGQKGFDDIWVMKTDSAYRLYKAMRESCEQTVINHQTKLEFESKEEAAASGIAECPVCNWQYNIAEWGCGNYVPAHNFPQCEGTRQAYNIVK